MYPYITIRWIKLYMTGIGIVISFLLFVGIVWYLSKKYLQSFWKFFYWLPILISLTYFLGSYTQFVFSQQQFIPLSWTDLISILSPYNYNFHFIGILAGIIISLLIFFKSIKTLENRKVWIDIFFFAFSLSLAPMWIFLLLWDNFIGSTTNSFLGVKSLHSESQRNKFDSVYPIGLFLSLWALFSALYIRIKSGIRKEHGLGMLGFAILLSIMILIFLIQQYPRYVVIGIGSFQLDIKQHVAFFVIMFCLYIHKRRKQKRFSI